MFIENTPVTGPIVVQVNVRALTRTFCQLSYRLRIVEVILDRYPIRIYYKAPSRFLESLNLCLLHFLLCSGLLRRLGYARQFRLLYDPTSLRPASPALEGSQQSRESALSRCNLTREISAEAGRLSRTTLSRARNRL